MNRVTAWVLKKIMRRRGYSPYFAHQLLQEIEADFRENKHIPLKQKLWAYKRGFFSANIQTYGLNDENRGDHLSDFDYYRLQPINGKFSKWIDDKLTIKYMLQPFNEYLPKYFYQLTNNGTTAMVTRLMDCSPEYGEDLLDIVKLLEVEGFLAAKLISGSRGTGFYRISFSENKYAINDMVISKEKIIEFLKKLDGYIITEYLFPHKYLGRIWDKTPNSLRIVTINEAGAPPLIAGSFMRFGSDRSGPVDNMCAGGVATFVDVDTGYFSNGRMTINNAWVESKLHPSSKAVLEGTLPYWQQIKETVLAVCDYLPNLRIMGFDIVISDNGFKIIEINSQPAMDVHNYYDLIYKNDKLKDFFINLKKEKEQ